MKSEETDKVKEFIEWRKGIQSEIRGGQLMFDVKGHYKWLTSEELLNYYFKLSNDNN